VGGRDLRLGATPPLPPLDADTIGEVRATTGAVRHVGTTRHGVSEAEIVDPNDDDDDSRRSRQRGGWIRRKAKEGVPLASNAD
jgi:hypothetical protein